MGNGGSGARAQGLAAQRKSGAGAKATTRVTQQELQERGAQATSKLRAALQLPNSLSDTKILGTALAEIAAEESARNQVFARAVRSRYDEIVSLRGGVSKSAPRQAKESLPRLVPIRRMDGYRLDLSKPPDPHFLTQLYGDHQLERALRDYTVDSLKRTAAEIEARHPGTKPSNRGRLEPLITYIVDWTRKEGE